MAETKQVTKRYNDNLDRATTPEPGKRNETSEIIAADTATTKVMCEPTSFANIRRYNSCPTKQGKSGSLLPNTNPNLNHFPMDQDYDYLLHQEEERLRQQRLQYYLRVLELERKKMDRLSRSRKQEHMKKANKFKITTSSPVSPV